MNKLRALLLALFAFAIVIAAQSTRETRLAVTIVDATTGEATPARVRLLSGDKSALTPNGALAVSASGFGAPPEAISVLYGRDDRAEGYVLQQDGSFYVDGSFVMNLPPGEYQLEISKGYEFVKQTHQVSARPSRSIDMKIGLERWIDMPARGWYSADDHIHLRRSPKDNASILRWTAAEDIHVGNLLQMGDFWTYVFSQYGWGEAGRYREGKYLLASGQEEPRTPEIGHTISLGANDFARRRDDYYSFDRLFDQIDELGGISGFAHQAMSFHGYRGMTLNVLRDKVDFVELLQFCVANGPLHTEHYYRFLNLGYRLTALAGSDFPWCGRGEIGSPERTSQIGDSRFYTYVDGEFSFENWFAALKAGRTFASTGPVVEITVNGKGPGETVDVASGATLKVSAKAFGHASQIPLTELEIVGHGRVLKRIAAGSNREELSIEMDLSVDHGIWLAVRAKAGPTQIAHSTPVYVTVDGGGFHDPEAAAQNLALCERDLQEIEQELRSPGSQLDSQAARHKQELERQIAETRAVLRDLGASLINQ